MTAELKQSLAGSAILMLLGLLAIYSGVRWLALILPVALLVWYESSASLRRLRGDGRRSRSISAPRRQFDLEWDNSTMRESGRERTRAGRRTS